MVSEYLAAGLRQGNFVRYFTDLTPVEDIRGWLTGLGMAPSKAEADEYLGITGAGDAYYPIGCFVPQEALDRMAARLAMADRLREHESALNTVTETCPYLGMCQYDARCFDGATLFKVLRAHPCMVAQGQVVMNSYYRRPEEFLPEFRADVLVAGPAAGAGEL